MIISVFEKRPIVRETCPFCSISNDCVVASNATGIAFHDGFPVSEGHSLIIPRKHVVSIFELSDTEQGYLWLLVFKVRSALLDQFSPSGFNIGVNDGQAAGQTVLHGHIHVIPRYDGDVCEPRGGIRWIIPDKAAYWEDKP